MTTVAALDPLIHEQSLLKHPFYQRWSKGELSLDDLRAYAEEYYHLVVRIPEILVDLLERIDDGDLRKQVEQNIREEREHVALWERFATSLGLSVDSLRSHTPSQKSVDAVRLFERTVQQGMDAGVSAIYALECELPEIARRKKEGLLRFYGLSTHDAHAYFDEHIEEEKHLRVWRQISVSEEESVKAAEQSLAAQHLLLDAVCERRGIPLSCGPRLEKTH